MLAAIAGIFATLVFAQAASADPITVSSGDSLQAALDQAAANPGPDSIVIGAGDFPTATGYDYPATADGAVTISGAGQGISGTSLALTAPGTGFSSESTSDVTIQDLSMAVPDGSTGFNFDRLGTLTNVTVNGPDGGTGVEFGGTATLGGVTIAFDPAQDSTGVMSAGPGTGKSGVLGGVAITAQTGINAGSDSTWQIARSRISGKDGIDANEANITELDNSLIEKTQSGGKPVTFGASTSKELDATNVTAVDATGDSSDAAFAISTGPLATATVRVNASLLGGFDTVDSETPGAGSTIDATYSDTDRYTTLDATPVVGPGNYHLLATAAEIDRVPDAAGEDLDGNPRTTNAYPPDNSQDRDIGAYEFVPHAPTVTTLAPSAPSVTSVTFHSDAEDEDPGDQLTYLWSFDGGQNTAGAKDQSHDFVSPGTHTANLTVVDLSGRTASASATVNIPAAPQHSPTVSLSASNASPAAGENVTFTASAGDADGDSLDYLWSFDGGASAPGSPTEQHSFSSPGPHTASVTVVDPTGRSASAATAVVVPSPPATVEQPANPQPANPNPFRDGTCLNAFNGTPGVDHLTGSAFGDAMVGGAGNDVIAGLAGNDCLIGDEGNDRLDGGAGDDDIRGLAGNDILRGSDGNDNLEGGSGKDSLDGGAGNDQLDGGSGVDRFKGGAGNDTINAADGHRESVNCGAGRDTVTADRIDRLVGCEKKKLRGRRR